MAKSLSLCPDCIAEPDVFCPRDSDGQCLECGVKLCAAHLLIHFEKAHFMTLTLKHCSISEKDE